MREKNKVLIKRKKMLFILILIVVVASIGLFTLLRTNKSNNKIVLNDSVDKVDINIEDESDSTILDEETIMENNIIDNVQDDKKLEEKSELIEEPEQKEIESSKDTEKKQEILSEESTIKNEVSVKKEENIVVEQPEKNESVINTSPSSEFKQEQKVVQESKPDETIKNNPWDSLGITEYEFYNSPAHSWAKLDFKISDYGSREVTFNACNDYGNKHKAEHGGGFECLPVNSYSGDYIGEMIEFY
ncbi:MAG: hypothetical protein IJO32_05295 [Bacilli bacterium]|nr:hypothetical protein [Bacilli bacterium]